MLEVKTLRFSLAVVLLLIGVLVVLIVRHRSEGAPDVASVQPRVPPSDLTRSGMKDGDGASSRPSEEDTESYVGSSESMVDIDLDDVGADIEHELLELERVSLLKLQYGDPETFVKLKFHHGLPYKLVREVYQPEVLPKLYELLDDPEFAPHWGTIAQMICFLGGDEASVPVLLDYITRVDDWSSLRGSDGYTRVVSKMMALQWMGLIRGTHANRALEQAFTMEGASELIKDWFDKEHLPEGYDKSRDQTIAITRGYAAFGLILTREPEHMALVEEAYRAEHEHNPRRGREMEFYYHVVDAMIAHRLIEKEGLEGYMALVGTPRWLDLSLPLVWELMR